MPRVSTTISDGEESQLLQRIAARDRRALEELYHAYHRRLARFLLRLAPRYDFAEEVINETFWIIWRKAAGFRGASRVSTWIMGIAYRRALRALRAARHDTAACAQEPRKNMTMPRRSTRRTGWRARCASCPTSSGWRWNWRTSWAIPARRSPSSPAAPSEP
jgi:DNA-directed RNA polymerase specialized sigma24 family protein